MDDIEVNNAEYSDILYTYLIDNKPHTDFFFY